MASSGGGPFRPWEVNQHDLSSAPPETRTEDVHGPAADASLSRTPPPHASSPPPDQHGTPSQQDRRWGQSQHNSKLSEARRRISCDGKTPRVKDSVNSAGGRDSREEPWSAPPPPAETSWHVAWEPWRTGAPTIQAATETVEGPAFPRDNWWPQPPPITERSPYMLEFSSKQELLSAIDRAHQLPSSSTATAAATATAVPPPPVSHRHQSNGSLPSVRRRGSRAPKSEVESPESVEGKSKSSHQKLTGEHCSQTHSSKSSNNRRTITTGNRSGKHASKKSRRTEAVPKSSLLEVALAAGRPTTADQLVLRKYQPHGLAYEIMLGPRSSQDLQKEYRLPPRLRNKIEGDRKRLRNRVSAFISRKAKHDKILHLRQQVDEARTRKTILLSERVQLNRQREEWTSTLKSTEADILSVMGKNPKEFRLDLSEEEVRVLPRRGTDIASATFTST